MYILIKNINDEELWFWCLYDIMYTKNWRLICVYNTPKLFSMIKYLRRRIYNEEPRMYKKMAKAEVPFKLTFTTYYVSCMIQMWSLETSWRIFDVFLHEGEGVITNIIINLHKSCKAKIMKQDCFSMNEYLSNNMLKDYLNENSIEALF